MPKTEQFMEPGGDSVWTDAHVRVTTTIQLLRDGSQWVEIEVCYDCFEMITNMAGPMSDQQWAEQDAAMREQIKAGKL